LKNFAGSQAGLRFDAAVSIVRFRKEGVLELNVHMEGTMSPSRSLSMARATALVAKFDEWEKLNDRLVQAIKTDRERLERYVVEHLTVPFPSAFKAGC